MRECEAKHRYAEISCDWAISKKTNIVTPFEQNNRTDVMKMQWDVLCANPIIPADWSIIYPPYIRPTDTFNITFAIKPNVGLTTR